MQPLQGKVCILGCNQCRLKESTYILIYIYTVLIPDDQARGDGDGEEKLL